MRFALLVQELASKKPKDEAWANLNLNLYGGASVVRVEGDWGHEPPDFLEARFCSAVYPIRSGSRSQDLGVFRKLPFREYLKVWMFGHQHLGSLTLFYVLAELPIEYSRWAINGESHRVCI